MASEWSQQKQREKKIAKDKLKGTQSQSDANQERAEHTLAICLQQIDLASKRITQIRAQFPALAKKMDDMIAAARPAPSLIQKPTAEQTAAVSLVQP